jgi:hypothetical protein
MESACSLSSTHKIVLFGRIFSLSPWNFPRLAGAVASTEVFCGDVCYFGSGTLRQIQAGKQVTETPISGKLCGELSAAWNRGGKAWEIDRLLRRCSIKINFS